MTKIPFRRPETNSGRLVMNAKEAREKFNLKPSKETLDKIEKRRQANIDAYHRLKDTSIGSSL